MRFVCNQMAMISAPQRQLGFSSPNRTIKVVIVLYERGCAPCLRAFAVTPPFLPSPRIVPDWSSPSRVRALPLRALDGSGPIQRTQFMREKRGSGRVDGPEGNLSAIPTI